MSNIGEIIRKYRIMHKYTQKDLADKMNQIVKDGKYTAATIAGYESGRRIPKLDVRMAIAKALKADPVALADLDLNELDKIRHFMKLLIKFNQGMSINDDGTVTVSLGSEFADFALKFNDTKERFEFLTECITEPELIDFHKMDQEDEIEFFTEMYPIYDAVHVLKLQHSEISKKNIEDMDEAIKGRFLALFYSFQDEYDAVTKRLRKKTEGS